MKMAVFDFALRKKGVYGVLHIIILLLSLFLVISISIDTFKNIPFYTQTSYKKIQLWICLFFLFDFVLVKERGAANIIANATFPLFTSGLEKFDKAVANGTLTYVVGTNLTYRMPELLTRDWYVDVDVSKYAAYFVVALNHDMSVSSIIDPLKKIENLLANRK